jgi:alpha-beta hydrolase superfamily lysophospholipase
MSTLTHTAPSPLIKPPRSGSLFESGLSLLWGLRHPLSPLSESLLPVPDRITYQTEDDWRVVMEHYPNTSGRGEPLLLYTGPLLHTRSVRLGEANLLQTLQGMGFDVFLFSHRGQRNATFRNTSQQEKKLGWMDILSHDVPSAIDAIKRCTGAKRVFWMGHGLGGLMLYSWLSMGGSRDLAGAITIDAPGLYTPTKIPLRLKLLHKLFSAQKKYPTRNLAQLYAQRNPIIHPDISPQKTRSLLHHCLEDLSPQLVQHILQWLETGRFCIQEQHYLSTIRGCQLPTLLFAGANQECADYVSFTKAYLPQAEYQKGTWKHIPFWDQASEITDRLALWTEPLRDRCWAD